MRFAIALSLSFVASVLAYQVIEPSASKGWTDEGPQTLTWNRVDTDPLNFTVVLANQDRSVFPDGEQVLAAQVDGKLKNVTLNPPAGGWPTGGSFRVNLAQDTDNLNSLLAQSNEFEIKAPTTSASTHVSTVSATRTVPSNTVIIPAATTSIAPATSSGSTGSDTSAPNASNKAFSVHAGLVSLFAALCLFLA